MNLKSIGYPKPPSKSKYSTDVLIEHFFKSNNLYAKYIDKKALSNVNGKNIKNVVALITRRYTKAASKQNVCIDLALHLAIMVGNLRIIESLLSKGARVNSSFLNKKTPLHLLCNRKYTPNFYKEARLKVVRLLINRGANVNAIEEENNHSPLTMAASSNLFFLTQLLLDYGSNKLYCNNEGYSAFHYAFYKHINTNILELLYDPKLDLNHVRTHSSTTMITFAMENIGNFSNIIQFLLKQGISINTFIDKNQNNILHNMCNINNIDDLRTYLKYGAQVNGSNIYGITPLHTFAQKMPLTYVKLLIEYGADLNILTDKNESVLHFAAGNKDEKVLNFLLDCKLDVNTEDNKGYTPLFKAVKYSYYKNVKLLIEYGGNVNHRNIKNRIPLHIAAFQNSKKIIKILLEHDSNINVQDDYGYTPISILSMKLISLSQSKLKDKYQEKLILYVILVKHAAIEYTVHNINKMNLRLISNFSKSFFIQCLTELSKMKSTLIVKGLTYYDILIKNNKLALYINNNTFMKKVKRNMLLYRIYCNSLKYNVDKAKEKFNLLSTSEANLNYLVQNISVIWKNTYLPKLISEHILSLLNDRDMINLSIAIDPSYIP